VLRPVRRAERRAQLWDIQEVAKLMPVCLVPSCEQEGTRHLLPHQAEIAEYMLCGEENYVYWQGGVGSAKTLLVAAVVVHMSLHIPGIQAICFRKDFGLNHETLFGAVRMAVDAAYEQGMLGALTAKAYIACWTVKIAGGHTICHLPNGSVIRAGETKNWSRYMGPTYDVIAVSDAMENHDFGEIFHGTGVVGGLQSRLRGQRSAFCRMADGSIRDMRRFLIETNPPPRVNELHEIFGREPGVRVLAYTEPRNITYRHIQTTSVQNTHNPPSYLAEISSQHPNRDDIRRILEGRTVPYYGGVRVIESFHAEVHVDRFTVDDALPLFVGIDPGYQHPAVVISQIRRCAYGEEHWITLSEISNLFNVTTWELAELANGDSMGILRHLGLYYPAHFDYTLYQQVKARQQPGSSVLQGHFQQVHFCIDRAGNSTSRLNKDRQGDAGVLARDFGIVTRSRANLRLQVTLDKVRELHKELCACAVPRRMVDQKCQLLIDAYSGGYRFKKRRDGSHSEEPVGDHLYEDIADADRYALCNFFWRKNAPIVTYNGITLREDAWETW